MWGEAGDGVVCLVIWDILLQFTGTTVLTGMTTNKSSLLSPTMSSINKQSSKPHLWLEQATPRTKPVIQPRTTTLSKPKLSVPNANKHGKCSVFSSHPCFTPSSMHVPLALLPPFTNCLCISLSLIHSHFTDVIVVVVNQGSSHIPGVSRPPLKSQINRNLASKRIERSSEAQKFSQLNRQKLIANRRRNAL